MTKMDIVGPVCESGDFFAQDGPMPELHAGDLLAIMSTGAYGFVMASNYNSRRVPAKTLVRGRKVELIRPRQSLKTSVNDEIEPVF
jgi:diaminopimelate decarboxylase